MLAAVGKEPPIPLPELLDRPELFSSPEAAQVLYAIGKARTNGALPDPPAVRQHLDVEYHPELDRILADKDLIFPLDDAAADAVELLRQQAKWEKALAAVDAKAKATAIPAEAAPDPAPVVWLDLVEDGAAIAKKELPPQVAICEGIVCEQSKLAIVSGAKAFKTWLTIHLALSIAHGVPFLERPTARRRVLYVNLELKPQTFDRRLQAIAHELGLTIDPAWFYHLPLRGKMAGLSVHEVVTRLIVIAKQLGAAVVVLDPVFKLNLEGEENSSRDQTVFFNQLDRLTTEAGCTLILNDHSGKGNQSEKDPLDVIRGSSAKGGDLDAAMVLRKHEEADCLRVDMVHRELPPVEPFVIGWRYPLMELRPDLDAADMKKPKGGRPSKANPEKLLAAIAETTAENPISISAWAQAAGIKRQTLTGYLPGFRAKGWIRTAGEGNAARQYLSEKGREAVQKTTGEA